jgi:hypothetical protein
MNCSNIRGRMELKYDNDWQGRKVEITIRNKNNHHLRGEEEIIEQGRNKKAVGSTGGQSLETNASDGQMTLVLMRGSGK